MSKDLCPRRRRNLHWPYDFEGELNRLSSQDHYLAQIKQATGLIVISVEYRLAPEHVYPAAVQDCEDVADWLYSNASSEVSDSLHDKTPCPVPRAASGLLIVA